MRRLLQLGLVTLISPAVSALEAGDGSSTQESKRVLENDFPALIAFRGEMHGPNHRSYEHWSRDLEGTSVVIRKFWNEELKIHQESIGWAQRYLAEHPETMFLWHLNGEARAVRGEPEPQERYFPGHWALHTGSFSTAPATKVDSEIPVEDISRFSMKGYIDRRKHVWHAPDLVIVERLPDGGMNWSKAEYARLNAVDRKGKTVTVERGCYGSEARDYGDNTLYIAPIVGGVWGGRVLWFYNHASTCPRDENGKQASDHFVDEIAAQFDPESGSLNGFSGVAFDVTYWIARWPSMDVDADGVTDDGYIDGRNVWREGMIAWARKLRKRMGPEFVVVGDGGSPKHQRAVGLFSGMEAEGFPYHHDAFRGYSTPINHFNYWSAMGEVPYPFNFAALKYKSDFDIPKKSQYARLGLGTLSCLGIHATRVLDDEDEQPLDEFVAGHRALPHWLGQPKGPAIQLAETLPDLLSGVIADHLTVENGTVNANSDGSWTLKGSTDDPRTPIILKLQGLPRPPGDVVLSLEARSRAPLAPSLKGTAIPRTMEVTVDELPAYEDSQRKNGFYNDLGGVFGTQEFVPQTFYFRDLGAVDSKDLMMEIRFEGQGELALRNLRLHSGSQLLARDFEHGVILVNPSLEAKVFDLAELFPGYPGSYSRIDGRRPENDGSRIRDPGNLMVPPLDALFLEKK